MNLSSSPQKCSKSFSSYLFLLVISLLVATSPLIAATAHAAQATLSWTAPTTYTDGSPLTTLAGYKLYVGTSSGSYSQNINVGNATSYTLTSLNDGTAYYFAVTAYDASGNVSGFSNQASYTTPAAPPSSALYTLTTTAGSGGSVTPSGAVVVSQGTSQTFTVTPATGYKVAGVTVDGASVGAVSSYTFSNVAANHTISATFASSATSYSISASSGTGGSISPAGTASVNSGGSQTYTITPNSGYKVAGVTVDGVSVGAVSSYAFTGVAANHTIAATFAASTSTSNSITSSTVWQNQSIASQNGVFTASFDMVPNAANIDAVTMLCSGAATAYTSGAAIVRFNTSGTIDARNGGAYAAAVSVPYTAGSTYHVRMVVNVPSHVYDVYVTPPGGAEIKLAAGYAFRTEQATASVLNDLALYAGTGSHTVMNFAVAPQSTPAPTPAPVSTSITSSTVWQNQSFASKTGSFSVAFDMVPNANTIDAVTMLSAVAAKGYSDGAAIVRFNPSGYIDARNGGAYAAAVSVPYTAGSTYHVRMVVNVPSHVYDVYVTPQGGTEIKLTAGYAFRTEQAAVSVLNNLAVYAGTGSHTVKNFVLGP